MNNMYSLEWLQKWYAEMCNGDWEHTFGIRISTLDNPGWELLIDLKDTKYENMKQPHILVQKNDDDWFSYKIEEHVFKGYGDPTKLSKLIETFHNLILKSI